MARRRVELTLAAALSRLGEGIAAALLAVLVVINGVAVYYRFVLNSPIGWSEEILRYCVIWLTFIAAGAVLRAGEHFALDLATSLKSARMRAALGVIIYLVIVVFCVLVAYLGYNVAMRNRMQVSPVLEISMMWPYLAIPVGMALMAIEAALLLIVSLRSVFRST